MNVKFIIVFIDFLTHKTLGIELNIKKGNKLESTVENPLCLSFQCKFKNRSNCCSDLVSTME